ncbi:MAG: FMN-binding protein [Trebonia sp.]
MSITVSNGKITSANGSLPQGGDSIAQNAIGQLNPEVLTAQSANIQAVSGATYTSQGYIGSLQQAVNQAGL